MKPLSVFPILPLLLLAACAGPRAARDASAPSDPRVETARATEPGPARSRVEISYVLGHSKRRFAAQAGVEQAWAMTYLEDQVLEQGRVDPEQYSKFLSEARAMAEELARSTPQRSPRTPAAETPACKSPFTLTVETEGKLHSAQGCREPGQTGISHLVRKGEFLLFSTR